MHDLIRFEASRARDWYAVGMQLMPLLDRRSAASAGAMAGIYRRLLEHIAARPHDALQHRMSLPAREKLMIAVTSLAGMGRPGRGGRREAAAEAPDFTRFDGRRGGPVMTAREVVVIGGGLAGISAAIALRDAGLGVTVLESRPRLGGAASSYTRGPMTIDNGQHVFLRCCTAYLGCLDACGARLARSHSRTGSTSRCCHGRFEQPDYDGPRCQPAPPGQSP